MLLRQNTFSAGDFRDALSGFATGVTIVTAVDADGAPIGMTASSFNSVSMDPPLVLWSVNKNALSGSAFKVAQRFSIHILAHDQTVLSDRFSRSGQDKFTATDFAIDEHGVPILPSTSCRFDCEHWAAYEGGDHWIIVGKVEQMAMTDRPPLAVCRGDYGTVEALRKPVETTDHLANAKT